MRRCLIDIRKGILSFDEIGKAHALNDLSGEDCPSVGDMRSVLYIGLIRCGTPEVIVLTGKRSSNSTKDDDLNEQVGKRLSAVHIQLFDTMIRGHRRGNRSETARHTGTGGGRRSRLSNRMFHIDENVSRDNYVECCQRSAARTY